MVFWNIKFGKMKINLFKGVFMFILTESVNKSFLLMWGLYGILVISVDVHSYFTGIALLIIPTTNTKQNFTIA